MSVADPNREKNSLKTRIFRVQGRSRSSMLVQPESSSAVLVMIRSKSVSICNRFHARRANSGKITLFMGVPQPLFDALVRGESPHPAQRHQITSLEIRDPRLPYGENPEYISPGLDSVGGPDNPDRQTDEQNSHS